MLGQNFQLRENNFLIIDAFHSYPEKERDEKMTDEFLELLGKEDRIQYQDLPEWVFQRIIIHHSLYYDYLDEKEKADNYIKVLSLKKT